MTDPSTDLARRRPAADISVLTGFDGSCPCDPQAVRVEPNRIVLFPGYRRLPGIDEEVPGKGSHLHTRLFNHAREPRPIHVVANWHTTDRVTYHDFGHIRNDSQPHWHMIPGIVEGPEVSYHLIPPPGMTELSLFPAYNVQRCHEFVTRLEAEGVEVSVIGHSRERREIFRIVLPATRSGAWPLLLQTRDHAYETAGSYAVEGIVYWLLSSDAEAGHLREHFDITVLPMTNPDGVYNGMSRLTHETGANLERVFTTADEAHQSLKREIDRIRPRAHMNIHNWAVKDKDGILASDNALIDRIIEYMPADTARGKHWFTLSTADWLKRENLTVYPDAFKSWRQYVPDHFAGHAAVFELPWFGLGEDDMRAKGVQAFNAFARAVLERLSTT